MKARKCICKNCQYCKDRDKYEKYHVSIKARQKKYSNAIKIHREEINKMTTDDLLDLYYRK